MMMPKDILGFQRFSLKIQALIFLIQPQNAYKHCEAKVNNPTTKKSI